MAYDPLAESTRLLDEGLAPYAGPLTRRRRFVPLGVDRAGDVGVTLFARRGSPGPWLESWTLTRDRHGVWSLLGGGGGGPHHDLFDARPARIQVIQGGRSFRGGGMFPWPRRAIGHTVVRLPEGFEAVAVAGRVLRIPPHGYVVACWSSRRRPGIGALDATGLLTGSMVPIDVR